MAAGAFADISSASRRSTTPRTGSRASRRRGATAARRTACRTTPARASSPTAPTCSRRPASRSCRRGLRAVHRGRKKLAAKNRQEGLLARVHRGHRLVRRDGLRLRLRRRIARRSSGKWIGRSTRRSRSRAWPRTRTSSSPRRAASKTTDETSRTRTTCTRRARRRRWSAPSWFSCCVGDEVQGRDRAVRDAGPRQGKVDAGLPRRLRSRGSGQRARTRRSRPTGSRPSPSTAVREGAAGEGQHPERDQPARQERQRARSRHEAGSCRRPSTGSTSRTETSCATCWRRS